MEALFKETSLNQSLDVLERVAGVSSALSPQTWPFSLEWLPETACLVGGSVRDALLGRASDYLDLDFVLPENAVETAQAIARHYKAGFVLLDAERHIARVVFPQGTADFALQAGPTLESDLERRDFTVNAIAYNPHTDKILDPLQGYRDLQRQTIRMVSVENLEEDPLRLLRAYRQAAQLGFTVELQTRSSIRSLAPLLRQIAAERIQSELNYLLSSSRGTDWLTAAWEDGLLRDWFPAATAESLAQIAAIDRVNQMFQETLPAFARELMAQPRGVTQSSSVSAQPPKASGSARTWLTIAKLVSLLPALSTAAEGQLRRLKYSRNEIQACSTVIKHLPSLQAAIEVPESGEICNLVLSLRQQYLFFQSVGATFPAIVVLAMAAGVPMPVLLPMLHRFLTPQDPVAHPQPLITGQDLMQALNLTAGPQIGRLLAEIQLSRADGTISTPTEALQLARNLLAAGEA